MRKIIPFKNRILLKYIDQSKTTKAGLIIPDTAKDSSFIVDLPDRGEIIALGKKADKKEFKIGDKVFFNRADPIKVILTGSDTHDGKKVKYMIIKDNEILGKIDD